MYLYRNKCFIELTKNVKVSGCNQFILATFKYIYIIFLNQSTKFLYLNVAKINWLQPLALKRYSVLERLKR